MHISESIFLNQFTSFNFFTIYNNAGSLQNSDRILRKCPNQFKMGHTINEKQTEFLSPKVRESFLCRPNNVGTFQFGVS